MRVAFWHNLPSGGAKRALRDQVEGLLARGHEVEVWSPPVADTEFLPLQGLVPEHSVPLSGWPPPWWRPGFRAPLRSPRSFINAMQEHCRSCAAEIDRSGFDVCLVHTCQVFAAPPLGRFLSTPAVLYEQEPHRWLYEANPDYPWLASPPPRGSRDRVTYPARGALEALRIYRRGQRARFEIDNARGFRRLLVNSAYSRETVLRVYGREASVCYLGIDTDAFEPTGQQRERLVVGVGTLRAHKRADLLIEAVARMPAPRPRVEWLAASEDPAYRATVERAAAAGGVDLRIHHGASDELLRDALNRAAVVVYTPRLEPFGLVPLEAASCAAPVIGVAEGGVRETVIDGVTGLLVEPEADALAAAIARVVDDSAFASELGGAAREWVLERWTADHASARLEAALVACLGER